MTKQQLQLHDKAVSDFHETGKLPDAATLITIGTTLVEFIKVIIDSLKGRKVNVLTDIVTHLAEQMDERQAETDKRLVVIEFVLKQNGLLK